MAMVRYDNATRIYPGTTRPAVEPRAGSRHAFHATTGERLRP